MSGGTVTINGRTVQVNNTTDCFYDISAYVSMVVDGDSDVGTFTITCTGDSIISLTNIKVAGSAEFHIINGSEEIVGGSAEPVEP